MNRDHISVRATYVMWHEEHTFGILVYSKEYTFPVLFI
jgi:hypothetical protein